MEEAARRARPVWALQAEQEQTVDVHVPHVVDKIFEAKEMIDVPLSHVVAEILEVNENIHQERVSVPTQLPC